METQQLSHYRDYLPAYLQTDPFLGRFLLAFEKVLSGVPEAAAPALPPQPFQPQILTAEATPRLDFETIISQIHTYFDPQQTPSEFLPWLAGWVALSLRDDWDEKVKRQFISQMVPLYQIRGTVPGLKKMLQIYLEHSGLSYPERTISIFEFDDRPHYFQVQLALPSNQVLQPDRYWRECRAAKAIIDQEKPAHTFYALRILTLTMQLTKAWGGCYPFTLFDAPPQQKAQIEARIQLHLPEPDANLEQQILIRIQGKTAVLEPNGSQCGPVVRQTVFYEKLLDNPDGFFVALANLSDRHLTGTLTVKLNFKLNQQPFSHLVFEAPFSLEPNLRIYRPLNQLATMPGNARLDSDPDKTLRIQPDAPISIYQSNIQYMDGNTRLESQVGRTMRLVHDARLRLYQPRTVFEQMEGNTRLGSDVGQTIQLSQNRQNPTLKLYRHKQAYKIGNTRLGSEVGHTMRLVPNSQWLEHLYRFRLFDPPATRSIEIEVLVDLRAVNPDELNKIARLLVLRMQSCASSFKPFTPDLEFSDRGIRATHHLPYQRFLDNLQGFYIVLTNVNDRPVAGKITIQLNFKLNQRPIAIVILEENFNLSPRDNVLEICHPNQNGDMQGNTILGRLTPYMLQAAAAQEEAWVD